MSQTKRAAEAGTLRRPWKKQPTLNHSSRLPAKIGEFVHIGVIAADILDKLGAPLSELALRDGDLPRDAVRDPIDAIINAYAIARAWAEFEPNRTPPRAVLIACCSIADDGLLLRLVNELAAKKELRNYARGERFLHLVRLCVGADAKGAA